MEFKAACVSAIIVLAGALPAAAGPVADAANRAETLQSEGRTAQAIAALEGAIDDIWKASPLIFESVELVDPPKGANGSKVAAIKVRDSHTYRADDTFAVRVEPIGFGYGKAESGAKIGFDADFSIANATGQVITEAKDRFSLSSETSVGRRKFPMIFSFPVPYIRPGEYVVQFDVRDQNSDKRGSFEVPITIAPPGGTSAAPVAESDPSGTKPAN